MSKLKTELRKNRQKRMQKTTVKASKRTKKPVVKRTAKAKTRKVVKKVKKAKANTIPYIGTPYNEDHSYGMFSCTACRNKIYSNRGEEMFCPACAESMALEADADLSGIGTRELREIGTCNICNSVLASDASSPDFCPQCGSNVIFSQDEDEEMGDDMDIMEEDDDMMEDAPEVDMDMMEEDDDMMEEAPEDDMMEEAPEVDMDMLEDDDEEEASLLEDAIGKIGDLQDELEAEEDQDTELQARAVAAAGKVKAAVKKLRLSIKAQDEESEKEASDDMGEALDELEEIENELPEDEDLDATAEEEEAPEEDEEEAPEEDEEEAPEEDEEEEVESYFLTELDATTSISASDVTMALFGVDTEDPYWNITIGGNPVARVSLSKQPRADEIREAFTASDYADNVANAIEKLGHADVLSQINADYFANAVNKSNLASELREEVLSDMDTEFKKRLAGVKDELLHCAAIVLAGANKNFFADADHTLKAALWENLKGIGVTDAMHHIEAAFDSAGNEFFSWVLDKAVAFMEKPKDAVDEIAKAIGDMNLMAPKNDEEESLEDMEEDSLASQLAQGNFNIQAMKTPLSATASTKEEIRKRIKLSKRY